MERRFHLLVTENPPQTSLIKKDFGDYIIAKSEGKGCFKID